MSSYNSKLKSFKKDEKSIVSKDDAEMAIKTLLKWIGDDPNREGLLETPKRVVRAFSEHFSGYQLDPKEFLLKTFEDIQGFDDIVILKNVDFESHCEHHMLPIIGKASIAYYPDKKIVGISKLARVLDVFSKRLQTQEIMTSQIINAIDESLHPLGTAIHIEAEHHCMITRGVHKKNALMITTQYSGCFKNDKNLQDRFLNIIK